MTRMLIDRRRFLQLAAAVHMLLTGCTFPLAGTVSEEERQSSFFCFDTACAIGGTMAQEVLDAAVERCLHFEQTLSRTIAASDVARINAAGGEAVDVEPETAKLLELARAYCAESDGLFDITIGAVSSLWDFHEGIVPDAERLAEAMTHVDYRMLQVDGQRVSLADPKAMLDLGGIAKGYVADVLVDELAQAGVTSAYINLGGNVKVLGAKADGSAWRVGVRDPNPEAEGNPPIARVELTGGSVVTSGLYERQFEHDGRRYWHILDPRTGWPVESDLVSATIVSERSIDGDGYTKPLFMMDRTDIDAWAKAHPDLKLLLVDGAGAVTMHPDGAFELLS